MNNAHKSGSNSAGVAGTFSRDLTKQSPCNAGILPGLWWLQMTGALL